MAVRPSKVLSYPFLRLHRKDADCLLRPSSFGTTTITMTTRAAVWILWRDSPSVASNGLGFPLVLLLEFILLYHHWRRRSSTTPISARNTRTDPKGQWSYQVDQGIYDPDYICLAIPKRQSLRGASPWPSLSAGKKPPREGKRHANTSSSYYYYFGPACRYYFYYFGQSLFSSQARTKKIQRQSLFSAQSRTKNVRRAHAPAAVCIQLARSTKSIHLLERPGLPLRMNPLYEFQQHATLFQSLLG
jgi:hypothetical protein